MATRCCSPPLQRVRPMRAAVSQAKLIDEVLDPSGGSGAIDAVEHEGHGDVFFGAQSRNQIECLKDQPDFSSAEDGEFTVGHLGEVFARDLDFARVGPSETGHEMEERAFARTAGAHDGQKFAVLNVQRDRRKSGDEAISLAEALGDVLNG